MRVLIIIKGLGVGGAERLLLENARYLSPTNRYWIANIDGRLENLRPQLIEAGYNVETFDLCSIKAPVSVWRLARFIAQHRISVIHAHLPVAGVLSRIIGRLVSVPVIYTEHNVVSSYHPITAALNKWTYSLNRKNITVSCAVQESVIHQYGRQASKVSVVVPNGVAVEAVAANRGFAAQVRATLQIPSHHHVFGTAARFHHVKRLDLLVTAFARAKEAIPASTLVLVGDGPTFTRVAKLAHDLGVAGDVRMVGMQSHPLPYIAALDTYVLCSEWEGMPVALLEAMALGRSIVASRVGGIPEMLNHNVEGLLFDRGDTDALVDAMCTLARTPSLAAQLGNNARERAIRHFDLQRLVRQTEALYAECLSAATELLPTA